MMKDVIALTPDMPDSWAVVAGLYAGGPELQVSSGHDGAVIQLHTADGRPLVSLEAPLLVHVAGEAERLLGGDVKAPPVPYWWSEVRASTAVPEAGPLAGSVAGRLTALLGGSVWPAEAATTDVVRTATAAEAVAATSDDDALTVDVLTDSTAVVLADRPVLALTAWLSAILRKVTDAGLALHIVTPAHVRLSLPLRTALAGAPNRWVVQDPECGYYDGLSGAVLHWQHGTFTPVVDEAGERSAAKVFTENAPATERQLGVAFRVTHRPDDGLVLGRSLEAAWAALTGAAPAGWGTAEPVNLRWSTGQLTDLARGRAPEPTHLLTVGHPDRPAIATHRVTRTPDGVAEDITLTLGYGEDEAPPLDAIEPLARTLAAEHGLTSMLVTLRRARRDLAVPPYFEAPPIPVSFTLGADDVHAIGLDHARRPPVELRPVPLGPTARPALYYPLGDGTDAQAWTVLQQLGTHLQVDPAN
ncbi:DUF6177 family protein [Streptomyces syringium]|uniref:DUF6177 family protein n=1 Tax=Streptomyces syringium TaxID=76729 RepID=UPI0036C41F10